MKIEIYCYRGQNYYGVGITPEGAVENAVKAGLRRDKLYKNYMMNRLPEGVSAVWVDDFGGLNWEFPKDWSTAELEKLTSQPAARLYLNSETNKWQEEEVEYKQPPGEPQLVHIKIEGWIEKRFAPDVENGISAEDVAHDWCECVDAPILAQELMDYGDMDVTITPKSKYKMQVRR